MLKIYKLFKLIQVLIIDQYLCVTCIISIIGPHLECPGYTPELAYFLMLFYSDIAIILIHCHDDSTHDVNICRTNRAFFDVFVQTVWVPNLICHLVVYIL